jgi:two-component system, chemotaxis family, protein-glutamate methylesterase/glutaminase
MEKKNIIVIGTSAGGLEVLKRLFSGLYEGIAAAVFIVWHIPPDVLGILPQVLSKHSTMPIAHAVDNEPIVFNRVYVAPPDRHMMIERGRLRLIRGPKENRFRPAIDPLFRSAAYSYGSRVIGIVLSGALDDGTAGLWTIKQFGGTSIVQDPQESEARGMPESALRSVKVDYKVTVREMIEVLKQLVLEPATENHEPGIKQREKTGSELKISMMEEQIVKKPIGELTPYTCPECHGVLGVIKNGDLVRFRCHTGHAFSADTLLSILTDNIEGSIWNAIRGIEESVFLLNSVGDNYAVKNDPKNAGLYFKKAKEMEARAKYLRQAIVGNEQLTKRKIEGVDLTY